MYESLLEQKYKKDTEKKDLDHDDVIWAQSKLMEVNVIFDDWNSHIGSCSRS